jgi:hypothetical protein
VLWQHRVGWTGSVTARFLTADDVAAELQVSLATAYRLMRQVSGSTVCTRLQFRRWLRAHTVVPPGAEPRRPDPGEPLVYFIRSGDRGPVKIGWTTDVPERVSRLQMGNPEPLRVLAIWPGGADEEARIHAEWSRLRIRGEWFAADEDT